MSTPAKVLLIGKEHVDLELRASILRHFWTVSTFEFGMSEPTEVAADIVIICETLSEFERQECVDHVRSVAPKMLVVKVNGYDSGPFAGADATVDEQHGPGALVSTVYELLTERGIRSRAWPEHRESLVVQ